MGKEEGPAASSLLQPGDTCPQSCHFLCPDTGPISTLGLSLHSLP